MTCLRLRTELYDGVGHIPCHVSLYDKKWFLSQLAGRILTCQVAPPDRSESGFKSFRAGIPCRLEYVRDQPTSNLSLKLLSNSIPDQLRSTVIGLDLQGNVLVVRVTFRVLVPGCLLKIPRDVNRIHWRDSWQPAILPIFPIL